MNITLCTIGFTGKTAEECFRLLREAAVHVVVDVRENRIGQLSGYAKYPDIEFFLKSIGGIAYRHEPELAPSLEIRDAYRKTKDWAQYEAAFLELMRARGIVDRLGPEAFSQTTALLCSEPGPEKCHRRLVAELLAEQWRVQRHEVEIRHLVAKRAPRTTRKKQVRP